MMMFLQDFSLAQVQIENKKQELESLETEFEQRVECMRIGIR